MLLLDELERVVSSPRQLAELRISHGGALAEEFVQIMQLRQQTNGSYTANNSGSTAAANDNETQLTVLLSSTQQQWVAILDQIIRCDPTLGEEIVCHHAFRIPNAWLNVKTSDCEDDVDDNVPDYQELVYSIMAFQKQFPATKSQSFSLDELRRRLPLSLSFENHNDRNHPPFLSALIHQVTHRQSAQSDVGFVLWPSAVILASYLVEQYNDDDKESSCCSLHGASRILELGSGCGLVGIVAAQLVKMSSSLSSSAHVILTDFNRTVLCNLQRNIILNELQDKASVVSLDFTMLQQNESSLSSSNDPGTVNHNTWHDLDGHEQEPVDLILAADVICQPSDAVAVARTINRLLSTKNGSRAILVSATAAHRFGVDRLVAECQQISTLNVQVTDISVDTDTMRSLLERTSGYVPGMKLQLFHVTKVQP